ncbi:hypothetical protein [Longimicrobium sp.]|uniref:hypothetical protein n=1 Tax=Longimicrobium sp. TaxID=2029185 RepID=UPI002E32A7FD|nr:hypothetical protein [Longimicrobium sp.]HEX6039021.1 hypothetical protein [Longimicrobium sp.]
MIRIRLSPLAAALFLAVVPAAAQTLPGAFTIPPGEYEYRWMVRVHPDNTVERTPIRGSLRLQPDGRFVHGREREGIAWSRSSGGYSPDGNLLYITSMTDPGAMTSVTDTFVVRHPGDRLFLWQNLHEEGKVEYELAPVGAPAERAAAPGVIPGLYGYVAEVLYYEAGSAGLPLARRAYATSFPAASTRGVWMQLQIEYPTALTGAEYPVTCRIRDAAGQVVNEGTSSIRVTPGSGARYFIHGWGADTPGGLPSGSYRVSCSIGGEEMLIQGAFQVT